MLTRDELRDLTMAAIILDDLRKFQLSKLDLWALARRLENAGPITEFDLQSGEGTSVEIIGKRENELWLIIDEDKLIKMIRLAFNAPEFVIDDLVQALREAARRSGRELELGPTEVKISKLTKG